MREIKFRGYSYAKQSWLYGNLIEKEDPLKAEPTPWVRLIHDRALSAELVAFGSVGQFSGLKDKNGKDIYEGDILKMKCKSPKREGQVINNFIDFFSGGTHCGFRLRNKSYSVTLTNNRLINGEMEIIGNIYENPELLK